jgi:hypothetical protein
MNYAERRNASLLATMAVAEHVTIHIGHAITIVKAVPQGASSGVGLTVEEAFAVHMALTELFGASPSNVVPFPGQASPSAT